VKSDGTKGWIRRFSPLKGKKRLRLLPTSARKITCDVAVQGACGAGEQFRDPEQTVTRNRDGLPFDTLVAMHEGVRVVPDIVDRELVGFGDEAFGRERIRVDRCDEFHGGLSSGRLVLRHGQKEAICGWYSRRGIHCLSAHAGQIGARSSSIPSSPHCESVFGDLESDVALSSHSLVTSFDERC